MDMVVRIIWAQFEESQKKKTMSSLQAEENKSHGGKKPVPLVQCRTEDMRGFYRQIAPRSRWLGRRRNGDQSDFSHWGISLGW